MHNFKSHADSKIVFDSLETSFVGTSDHGKTTILKALHLVCQHGNWPEDWIRKGTDSGWVEVELTNGNRVRRDRTRTSQSTTVTIGGVTKKLEGVKTAEPYVRKALGFNLIILDESTGPEDLNFIGVNDSSYGMNSSPEVMLRKISGILGTNVIEDARNRLTKENKKLSSKRENVLEELGPLRARVIARKSLLELMENSFNELNQLNADWNDRKQKLEKLKKIRDQFVSPLYTIHQISTLLELAEKISKNLSQLKDKIRTSELLFSLKSTQINIDIDWSVLDAVQTDFKKLREYTDSHSKLIAINSELRVLDQEIRKCNSQCEETMLRIGDLTLQKQSLLKQLKICPVCGQEIK